MGKIVSASEFKAKCLRFISDMEKDGESVTVTKRGKIVAEFKPPVSGPKASRFGSVQGNVRWFVNPSDPVGDVDDWAALR